MLNSIPCTIKDIQRNNSNTCWELSIKNYKKLSGKIIEIVFNGSIFTEGKVSDKGNYLNNVPGTDPKFRKALNEFFRCAQIDRKKTIYGTLIEESKLRYRLLYNSAIK